MVEQFHWPLEGGSVIQGETKQKRSGSPSRETEVSLPEHMLVLSRSGIIWMTFPMGDLFPLHIYPKSGERLSSHPVSVHE